MKNILLKYGILSVLLATVLAAILVAMVRGESAAVAAVYGGFLAGGSFVGLIYVASGLVEEQARTVEKLSMVMILTVKLAGVGVALWFGLVELQLAPDGMAAGIGAAILGLTLGLNKATSSAEARTAMAQEEARIVAALEKEEEEG